MMNYLSKKIIYISISAVPFTTFAQTTNAKTLLDRILDLIILLLPISFSLAIAAFFFGIAKFIFSAGKGRDDGKEIMTWGVIAIFVMTSIFGLTAFIRSSIGIGEDAPLRTPSVRDNLNI